MMKALLWIILIGMLISMVAEFGAGGWVFVAIAGGLYWFAKRGKRANKPRKPFDAFPYLELCLGPTRPPCPVHCANQRLVLPKGHKYWDAAPVRAYICCRCRTRKVSRHEYERILISQEHPISTTPVYPDPEQLVQLVPNLNNTVLEELRAQSQPLSAAALSELAKLHREATTTKEKDWNRAIHCLVQARNLMLRSPTDFTIEQFLRLPLFLQQAGRMDEAVEEFKALLAMPFHPHQIGKVYDKMRLAYQREEDFKNAAVCAASYAAIEFINEADRDAYSDKVVAPLYEKAMKQEEATAQEN